MPLGILIRRIRALRVLRMFSGGELDIINLRGRHGHPPSRSSIQPAERALQLPFLPTPAQSFSNLLVSPGRYLPTEREYEGL